MTGRPPAPGRPSRHWAVEFRALPSRIGQVRRIVTAQLRYWRLDPLIDAAALGVTELMANVHRHAGPDKHCTVEIVLSRERLTVSVRDHDPSLPRVRTAAPGACSGRGLALVAAMSSSWGMRAQDDGSGKVVWFTLPVGPGRLPYEAVGELEMPEPVTPPDAAPAVTAPPAAAAAPPARLPRTAPA